MTPLGVGVQAEKREAEAEAEKALRTAKQDLQKSFAADEAPMPPNEPQVPALSQAATTAQAAPPHLPAEAASRVRLQAFFFWCMT